jgi:hypothetical protein
MTAAAKSVYYFGIYLYLVSATLIFVPNILLGTLGIPEINEVWIRALGVLAGLIGFYFHRTGAKTITNCSKKMAFTFPSRWRVSVIRS